VELGQHAADDRLHHRFAQVKAFADGAVVETLAEVPQRLELVRSEIGDQRQADLVDSQP
jgi:hypothetical protein